MKRFLICAAAAIVALASCSKTQVVYNEAPEEIGFKAVSGVMTKAATTLDGHTDMGVYAHYATNKAEYFSNAEFESYDPYWKGNPVQYWPLGGAELNFVFYAPYNSTTGIIGRAYDASNNTLTIAVDNTNVQTNWLYGSAMTTGSKATDIAIVSPTMKHLLAKIEVNLTGTVSINKMTLTATEQKEIATINYSTSSSTVTWTNNNDPVNRVLLESTVELGAEAKKYECYVIPGQTQTSIVLNYSLPSGSATDYSISLSSLGIWTAGAKYIYNIKVEPGEILFNPQVEEWSPETTTNIQFNDGTGQIL